MNEAECIVIECECGTLWKPSHYEVCPGCDGLGFNIENEESEGESHE